MFDSITVYGTYPLSYRGEIHPELLGELDKATDNLVVFVEDTLTAPMKAEEKYENFIPRAVFLRKKPELAVAEGFSLLITSDVNILSEGRSKGYVTLFYGKCLSKAIHSIADKATKTSLALLKFRSKQNTSLEPASLLEMHSPAALIDLLKRGVLPKGPEKKKQPRESGSKYASLIRFEPATF